jgi:hypothetical protein
MPPHHPPRPLEADLKGPAGEFALYTYCLSRSNFFDDKQLWI